MRISDWSSDVCSSDLRSIACSRCRGVPRQPGVQQREIQGELRHLQQGTAEHFTDYFLNEPHGPRIAQQRGEVFADRKSVVYGQSVSVRLDIGGSRIIKKTNTESHTNK